MLLTATLIAAGLLVAESPDTLLTASIIADRGVVVSRTDTLKSAHSQTITEVLLLCPGAYAGDNGGYAGLKTVNLRGMGSPHTAIYLDGVRIGNAQSGQSDLGVLGLESISSAVIDYAQNSVSLYTARPSFNDGRKVGGSARLSAGSFGTFLPSARLDWKISDNLTLSANAEAVVSKGDFGYGEGLVRENNDISQIKGGLDMFGTSSGGDWHVKAGGNGSDRGTPGSISWPSTDRQRDRNIFIQGVVREQVTDIYHLTASAKTSYDDIYYTSAWGDSRYGQTEAQLNSTHKLSIRHWLDLSLTADAYWDGLNSTLYSQQRIGTTGAAAAAFHTKRFKADAAIQYDGAFDCGQTGRNCFSPSLDLRFTAFDGFDIIGFVRRAQRIPTFNELYYVGYGNPDLKPEDALLTDIGMDWAKKVDRWTLKLRADGFYNRLRDKITSAPSQEDPNIWQPYNIGRVRSAGVDLTAEADLADDVWNASFVVRYGFQDAVDKTPDSSSYGEQLAYIARHSLSVSASAQIKGWSAHTVWNLRSGRRDSYGEMPDWNTLDIRLKKAFNDIVGGIPALTLTLKNVTNCRYETVSGYPMPGFSFIGGIEYKF